jgi:acetyltransferase-like isoleucine patch superfamily enzyme
MKDYLHCGGQHHEIAKYKSLKKCGHKTKIYRSAVLCNESNIEIGESCSIDDFTFINGGISTTLGDRVHFASFSSIVGGGETVIDSFVGIAAGCRIISGSDECMGMGLTNPCVPTKFREFKSSKVVIGKHSLIFSNSIILPGTEIGEGVVVSAGSIVTKNLTAWGVYQMRSDKLVRVAERPREKIISLEKACISEFGY